MARCRLLLAAVAVVALAMSGCASVANIIWFNEDEGGQRVFGGVRGDCEVFHDATAASAGSYTGEDRRRVAVLSAVDLPFSAVGDVVTLPLTVPCALWRLTRGPVGRFKPPPAEEAPAVPVDDENR